MLSVKLVLHRYAWDSTIVPRRPTIMTSWRGERRARGYYGITVWMNEREPPPTWCYYVIT